jgi:hypothetical protein
MISNSGYRFSEKIMRKLKVRPQDYQGGFPWLMQR